MAEEARGLREDGRVDVHFALARLLVALGGHYRAPSGIGARQSVRPSYKDTV